MAARCHGRPAEALPDAGDIPRFSALINRTRIIRHPQNAAAQPPVLDPGTIRFFVVSGQAFELLVHEADSESLYVVRCCRTLEPFFLERVSLPCAAKPRCVDYRFGGDSRPTRANS